MDTIQLPNDYETLKTIFLKSFEEKIKLVEKNIHIEAEKNKLLSENKALRYELNQFKLRFFKPHSEKMKFETGQMELFNEAEKTLSQTAKTEETEKITYTRRKGRKRQHLDLSGFPSVDIVHDLPEAEKIHSCGRSMKQIGQEITQKVRIIPKQLLVENHIRPKYACECNGVDTEGVEGAVRIAPLPPQMIEKSIATPSFLADVLVSKFSDALPFYRQEKILNRYGFEISRETLSRWAVKGYERAEVLADLMEEALLSESLISIDETTVQVLNEDGKKNESKSYMWVARGGPPGKPVILFRYSPSRSGGFVRKLLQDWEGILVCDGYGGYDSAGRDLKVRLAGCWAHARRKFVEILKATKGEGWATEAVEQIRQLYLVEDEGWQGNLNFEGIRELRQRKAKPLLEEFKKWLDLRAGESPPTSPLGKAVRYALGDWAKLQTYLEDGRVPIDNNLTENAIRPFVIGKKNWLFSACPSGAKASAFWYSMIETAKANGLEPYWYLNYLFEKFPLSRGEDDYRALLPWNLTPEIVAKELDIQPEFATYRIPARK